MKRLFTKYGPTTMTCWRQRFSADCSGSAEEIAEHRLHRGDDLGWKDVGFNGCTDIKPQH